MSTPGSAADSTATCPGTCAPCTLQPSPSTSGHAGCCPDSSLQRQRGSHESNAHHRRVGLRRALRRHPGHPTTAPARGRAPARRPRSGARRARGSPGSSPSAMRSRWTSSSSTCPRPAAPREPGIPPRAMPWPVRSIWPARRSTRCPRTSAAPRPASCSPSATRSPTPGDDASAGPIMRLVVEYQPDNYMALYHAGHVRVHAGRDGLRPHPPDAVPRALPARGRVADQRPSRCWAGSTPRRERAVPRARGRCSAAAARSSARSAAAAIRSSTSPATATLDTEVALKLLVPPPAAAQVARERMRREVQAVRGLSHANIVAVFDFLEDGPWSFIVMEYVRGPDLQVRVRERGRLDADAAVRLGRDIAGRARHRAPARHPSPRREAAERPARPRRPVPTDRLRLGQARRPAGRHQHRRARRHPGLHRARGARRPPGRCPGRHLRPGTHPLLRADR